MIRFLALLDMDISFRVAPSTTGATTLACSFGCLSENSYQAHGQVQVKGITEAEVTAQNAQNTGQENI